MARPKGPSTGRERLIEAASRSFRLGGFGGAGVDAVAKQAGVTSGAFYAHFGSKAEAFRTVLADGVAAVRRLVERLQDEHGPDWRGPLVEAYLGAQLNRCVSEVCPLVTLTMDAARADDATRAAYEGELAGLVAAIARGLPGRNPRDRAWRLLSLMVGAATMGRALPDGKPREELVAATKAEALRI